MTTNRIIQLSLSAANMRLKAAHQELVVAVALARAQGASWQNVGDALNVSKQAAWDRFAKHVEN